MRLLPLSRGPGAHPSRSRPRPTRRLVLEPLDDRLCPSSTVIDLGTLGGTSSTAYAMNAAGQVVGLSYIAGGTQGNPHAFLWQNGSMTDLGTLGGTSSWAQDINAGGHVVGSSRPTAGSTVTHGFLWTPTTANGTSGGMADLGTLGGESSNAQAINNHGQIVGYSMTAAGAYHAVVWEAGVLYDLNDLLPAGSGWELHGVEQTDINDNGQISGTGSFNGQERAFLLSDPNGVFADGGATIKNLGALGTGMSSAYGLNASGQVVGWSNVANGNPHAFRSSGGVMTDLKTLTNNPTIGENTSYAYAINDSGHAVGISLYDQSGGTWNYHAVIWQGNKIGDLNRQLPRNSGWVLESAYDIDGAGRIVGAGRVGGQRHAFLLVPGGSPLQAVAVGAAADVESLTPTKVRPLFDEAVARWQAAGVDTGGLSGVDVRIADLGGATLGLASGNTIWLDDDAAGWGWFVDPTPSDDSEFTTPGNQGEEYRIDQLTVLGHEIGHLFGHDHDAEGVMAETLSAGVRQAPIADSPSGLPTGLDEPFPDKPRTRRRW